MTHEERDIEEVLEQLQTDELRLGALSQLSDLDEDELEAFEDEWIGFDLDRRRMIATELQELSEESLELDFRVLFSLMLKDADPLVRRSALRGMFEDTRRTALSRLLEVLQTDDDRQVRATAATVLGSWTFRASMDELNPSTSAELIDTLQAVYTYPQTSYEVRRRLLESLGYIGHLPWVTDAIETARREADEHWQQSALFAMGRSAQERWLPHITNSLDADSGAMRFEAARAAGEFAEEAQHIVPELAKLIVDDDVDVATAAIWSLGQIGGDKARKLLEGLAKSTPGPRKSIAEEALEELTFFTDPLQAINTDDFIVGDDDDDLGLELGDEFGDLAEFGALYGTDDEDGNDGLGPLYDEEDDDDDDNDWAGFRPEVLN